MSFEVDDISFEKYYLASFANENRDGSTPIQLCSAERNSLVRLHNEGLKKLDNESTCLLLKQHLAEYSKIFHDNSTPNSVNGLSKPIEFLLKGKVQTRHCSGWQSNLRSSTVDPIAILKKNLNLDANCNMNKNKPCNGNEIKNEQDALKWLFEMKTLPDEKLSFKNNNSAVFKPQINNAVKNQPFVSNNDKITPLKNVNNQSINRSYPFLQHKQPNKSSFSASNNKIDPSNDGNRNRLNNFKNNPISSIEPPRKAFKTEFNDNAKRSNMNCYNNKPNNTPNFMDNNPKEIPSQAFKTARQELAIQNKKNGSSKPNYQPHETVVQKKSLGTTRSVQSKFIPPIKNSNDHEEEQMETETIEDERLKHIDPKMIELIRSEIIDSGASVGWQDIAGLEFAKSAIQEAVVWPLLRPDIFTGLRRPPRGILLFGPPGTGKTLIGKCIASQCHATFFSISASSLTSKWLGDGEKMVRALFAVARCHQPAVVFIDEIDSLLTQRSDSEHEATRRIKTEFLVQLDGAATGDEDRLLLIGATNRPQELDEAARRRLVKRLYIPLPDFEARKQIVNRLMSTERHSLNEEDIDNVANLAEGFSGADMRSLCGEAALGPIRTLPMSQITNIQSDEVRPVNVEDFKNALMRVRPSVSSNDLEHYRKWDLTYGSGSNCG